MSINSAIIIFCPKCQSQTTWQNNPNRPFCSSRCKTIDFSAWVNQDYSLSSDVADSDGTMHYKLESNNE